MDAPDPIDSVVCGIAAAIGEPARARMLFSLMDGRARTSTELAAVAEIGPSTASAHLNRLRTERLIKVVAQGKQRYYSLQGPAVARALEGLNVLAGRSAKAFVPNTPNRLRMARTCYDHMAGTVGVLLHDRLHALGWFGSHDKKEEKLYDLSGAGKKSLGALGIDVDAAQALRRRFACPCLDWSERRPHIGGAMGAALLTLALKRKWVTQDPDSRALEVTRHGRREMLERFGLSI